MRIVSGKYRGRAINPPKNLRARPTTDFAKENLFNVLGNLLDFEECDVLDLFAGTGSGVRDPYAPQSAMDQNNEAL